MSILDEPILGKNPKSVSISNSEIQTYKKCKRRWYLGTYLGLAKKEKEYSGPLSLGNRLHNALEHYYTTGDNPVDEYNRLQNADNKLFLETKKASLPEEVKKFQSESELGRLMLEGYMEWLEEENADSAIEVVGAEKKLAYRLVDFDPRVELIGKVDLRVKRGEDGSRAIFDHKSAAASGFADYWKYGKMSEQLMLYTTLERLTGDEEDAKVDGGIYNVLKKVKRTAKATPPFYQRVDVRFNKKTLESFWIRTLGTVRDIMATRDALDEGQDHRSVAYPSPQMSWVCGTCPFFDICEMMDDGSRVESYIEDYYETVDPNKRYLDSEEQENNG